MAIIKKIRPSWEHVDTDKKGNWYFAITDTPVDTMTKKQREAMHKKTQVQLEGKQRL